MLIPSRGPPNWCAEGRQLSRKATKGTVVGEPPTPRGKSSVSVSSGPTPEFPRGSDLGCNASCSGNPDSGKVDGKQRMMTDKLSAAGHTHDKGYNKWDKFDVDAALLSIDSEDRDEDKKARLCAVFGACGCE